MNRLLSRLLEIVLKRDFEYAEIQGAGVAVVWGIWLVLFPHTDVRCVARIIESFTSAQLHGILFLAVGLLQVWALADDNWLWRRRSALFAVMLWLGTGIMVALQNYRLAPVPLLFSFAAGAAWSYWRMQSKQPDGF